MAKWVVVVSGEQFEAERLYGGGGGISVAGTTFAPGDEALLVGGAAGAAVVFGLARADSEGKLWYSVNLLDAPIPAEGLAGPAGPAGPVGARRVDEGEFQAAAASLAARERDGRSAAAAKGRRTWLVSVDMPIEADSPGAAVRAFWGYVRELGPAELPAFVWPAGDELAMQAYVLGVEANQDPEED